MRKAKKILT